MKRSPVLFLFIFLLPGIIMSLTCISIGIDPVNLPIGVVNYETNCAGISLNGSCEADILSCYYLHALNNTEAVRLENYDDAEAMTRASKTAKLRGSITVPANFSHSLLKRLLKPDMYNEWIYYHGIEENDQIGAGEKLAMSLDTSDTLAVLVVRQAVWESLETFAAIVNAACETDLDGEVVDLTMIEEGNPSLGRKKSTYQDYVVASFLAQMLFFLAMSLTSESFITERAQGLLERSWLVGVLPFEILTSYILTQFLVIVIQVATALVVVFGVFQMPCSGSLTLYSLLCLLQGFVGVSYGFLLSTFCSTTAEAMKLSISSFFPSLMLCGVVWPLEGMPYPWLRELVWYLPQTAGMQGLRDIALRGWGLSSPAVYQGFTISASWMIFFFVLSWLLVRNKI